MTFGLFPLSMKLFQKRSTLKAKMPPSGTFFMLLELTRIRRDAKIKIEELLPLQVYPFTLIFIDSPMVLFYF